MGWTRHQNGSIDEHTTETCATQKCHTKTRVPQSNINQNITSTSTNLEHVEVVDGHLNLRDLAPNERDSPHPLVDRDHRLGPVSVQLLLDRLVCRHPFITLGGGIEVESALDDARDLQWRRRWREGAKGRMSD